MAQFTLGNVKRIQIGDTIKHIGADATDIDLVEKVGKVEADVTEPAIHFGELNEDTYQDKKITLTKGSNNSCADYSMIIGDDYLNADKIGSIAHGNYAEATGKCSYAGGDYVKATGICSHAEGAKTQAIGEDSHAGGQGVMESFNGTDIYKDGLSTSLYYTDKSNKRRWRGLSEGHHSFSHGYRCIAIGVGSFAAGYINAAEGDHSFAAGYFSSAKGDNSFALGNNSTAEGNNSFAAGYFSNTKGNNSFALGNNNKVTVSGENGFTAGYNNTVSGKNGTALGHHNTVSGENGFAAGYFNTSSPSNLSGEIDSAGGFAIGYGNEAQGGGAFACGTYSKGAITHPDAEYWRDQFVIGCGNGPEDRRNAFAASKDGHIYMDQGYVKVGLSPSNAVYIHGDNSSNEGTVNFGGVIEVGQICGHLPGVSEDTLRIYHAYNATDHVIATGKDNTYIKNNCHLLKGHTDGSDYAEYIYPWYDNNENNEDRTGYFVTVKDDKLYKAQSTDYVCGITSETYGILGTPDSLNEWHKKYLIDELGRRLDINPEYDENLEYVSREKRPEWSAVGIMGQVYVRDDGTCIPGQLCKCADGGIATLAEQQGFNTWIVLERTSKNTVKILFK